MAVIPYLDLSFGTDMGQDPKVIRAQYGDGYSARKTDGINSVPQIWNLRWDNIPEATAEDLRVFFQGLAGVGIVDWQPYGQPASLKFTASKFKSRPTGYLTASCSVQLEQEFDL